MKSGIHMIRLIAADMDGTLLDENGLLPSHFGEVFERLCKENILFAVASGRQYGNLLNHFREFRDKMVFIAENGTFVVYRGETLYSSVLAFPDVLELAAMAKKVPGAACVVCGIRAAYVENNDVAGWPEALAEIRKYYAAVELVDSFRDVSDEILKFTVLVFEGSEKYALPVFAGYKDRFKLTVSGDYWLDITMHEANKGIALDHIQTRFGIAKQETMAFGDFLNDVELLQNAGYSYAMKNAHPGLFPHARFRAMGNEEDGVLREISRMLDTPSEFNANLHI